MAHTSDDDDRTYRTSEEVEAWRKKDPLRQMKQYLIEQRLLSEADEDRLEAEVKAEVDEAAKRAEAQPFPEPADAYTKVFARPLRPLRGVPDGAGDQPVARRRRAGADGPDDRAEHGRHGSPDPARPPGRGRAGGRPGRGRRAPRRRVPRHRRAGRRVRRRPRARHAARRVVDHRHRDRPRARRAPTDRRDPVRRLHPLGLRPARQRGGPHPLPVQRRLPRAARGAGAVGRRRARRALPLAVDRGDLRAHPRAQGGGPVDARRPGRAAPRGDRRPRPGAVPRAQEDLPADQGRGAGRLLLAGADRRGRDRPRRAPTPPSSPTACTGTRGRGRRPPVRRRRRRDRGARPAHHLAARRRRHPRLGAPHQPLPRGPRGQPAASASAPRSPPWWPRRPSTTSTHRCAGCASPDVPSFPFAPPLEAELSIGADEIASALRALLDA